MFKIYWWPENKEDEIRDRIVRICSAFPEMQINEKNISFEDPAYEKDQGMVFVVKPDLVVLSEPEKESVMSQLRSGFGSGKKPRIIFEKR